MSHIPPKSIVYGINPVSEFGVAKRQVTSKENGLTCTSTTVKLGFLEIHMASLEEVTEVDASTMTSNDKRSSDDSHDDNKSDEGIMTQPKPMALFTMPTMQQMQDFGKRFDTVSEKIQHHMYQNAMLIKNELENDFMNRTFQASGKVVGSFEKNLVRMKKTLVDTYKFLSEFSRGD